MAETPRPQQGPGEERTREFRDVCAQVLRGEAPSSALDAHAGKDYRVSVFPAEGYARVTERRRGLVMEVSLLGASWVPMSAQEARAADAHGATVHGIAGPEPEEEGDAAPVKRGPGRPRKNVDAAGA